jgi:hypothetical protein
VNAGALHAAWAASGIGDDEWLRSLRTFNVAAPEFAAASEVTVAVTATVATRDDGTVRS